MSEPPKKDPSKARAAKRRYERMRPSSRDYGYERVRELKCFQEVYDRILDGWPIAEIARFIQDIKKESLDVTKAGLMAALQGFRASLPPGELAKKRMPGLLANAANEVEAGLDEMREMEKLYRLQMNRLDIDIENEKKIKKLLPTTGQEVRIAREILSNYAELKMDLGLSKRHIGQMDVDARLMADVAVRYNKTEVTTVLNDPQSRKRVLGLVERLMSKSTAALAEGSVSSVIDTTGEVPELGSAELSSVEDEPDPILGPIDMGSLDSDNAGPDSETAEFGAERLDD